MKLHNYLFQIRKKEGSFIKKIAVLEQKIAQMKTEISDSIKRESKSKWIYEQILKTINEQIVA